MNQPATSEVTTTKEKLNTAMILCYKRGVTVVRWPARCAERLMLA